MGCGVVVGDVKTSFCSSLVLLGVKKGSMRLITIRVEVQKCFFKEPYGVLMKIDVL